jgi:release factor glutamine methyltransferase
MRSRRTARPQRGRIRDSDRPNSPANQTPISLRSALKEGLTRLLASQVPSASLAAELILMCVAECDRAYLYTHAEAPLSATKAARYFELVAERAAGKPTQYITGHQEFWGLDFQVSPAVLIPRPETEHLIEAVMELAARQGLSKNSRLRMADVGTGSGCIALAAAHEFPRAEIFATDISTAALGVAARNAARLGMGGRVRFVETDLLNYFSKPGFESSFDFVVSNPPYVTREEVSQLQREVREYEPRVAWGGLEQADEIYSRLFPQAHRLLKPAGYILVEIGYNKRETVLRLLARGWAEIAVKCDLAGIPRVVAARKNGP